MNWAAWILLIVVGYTVVSHMFVWGEKRYPFGWKTLIAQLILFFLLLVAFDIIQPSI